MAWTNVIHSEDIGWHLVSDLDLSNQSHVDSLVRFNPGHVQDMQLSNDLGVDSINETGILLISCTLRDEIMILIPSIF